MNPCGPVGACRHPHPAPAPARRAQVHQGRRLVGGQMDPTADRGQRSPLGRAEGQARYPHPSGTIPRTCARRSTARSMPLAHGLGRRDDDPAPRFTLPRARPHSVPSRAYARGTTPASPACTDAPRADLAHPCHPVYAAGLGCYDRRDDGDRRGPGRAPLRAAAGAEQRDRCRSSQAAD